MWGSRGEHRGTRLLAAGATALALSGAVLTAALLAGAARPPEDADTGPGQTGTPPVLKVLRRGDLTALELHSPHAVLLDLDSGETLYQKAENEPAYPASLTKLMTAVVAVESLPDLSVETTLPESLFRRLLEAGASVAGFLPGETVTAEDLLYAALLPSGSDGAVGLAVAAAGSEVEFVERMNRKAVELGMDATHFVNATGLHDKRQVTTASDMAILVEYAMKNQAVARAFTVRRHTVTPTNRHPGGLTLHSTLFRRLDAFSGMPEGVELLGGKTGYTDEAGLCLASTARVSGKRLLLVTLGASGNNTGEPLHIEDALAVYSACQMEAVPAGSATQTNRD